MPKQSLHLRAEIFTHPIIPEKKLLAIVRVRSRQISGLPECNYIVCTSTTISVLLGDLASISPALYWIRSYPRGLHTSVGECHNDVSLVLALRNVCVYVYVWVRVLQRVSEPRHSKAINVMPYTRHRSKLHRHSARFYGIIFHGDARAYVPNIQRTRDLKIKSHWCGNRKTRRDIAVFFIFESRLNI